MRGDWLSRERLARWASAAEAPPGNGRSGTGPGVARCSRSGRAMRPAFGLIWDYWVIGLLPLSDSLVLTALLVHRRGSALWGSGSFPELAPWSPAALQGDPTRRMRCSDRRALPVLTADEAWLQREPRRRGVASGVGTVAARGAEARCGGRNTSMLSHLMHALGPVSGLGWDWCASRVVVVPGAARGAGLALGRSASELGSRWWRGWVSIVFGCCGIVQRQKGSIKDAIRWQTGSISRVPVFDTGTPIWRIKSCQGFSESKNRRNGPWRPGYPVRLPRCVQRPGQGWGTEGRAAEIAQIWGYWQSHLCLI